MKNLHRNIHEGIRLTEKEKDTLKKSVLSIDPNAKVYLFGSRTDRSKRGGDIDLLIISKVFTRKDISRVRWYFFERFGEQKMDIIVDDGTLATPFVKIIFPKAILL
ncbi:nucleotidyltransferase domain-containing protein [Sulfurovum riftiae]|uniref:DNA polymerase III subunit beta n=1 Tax=Sulfurovum riftiae TaxID=1630136 RepID=A0A151CEC4_9BACT|nr:nucleotidyltransferase domain-containing protein [Sulfurovum riftiae]KYJ85824.1 DNA polymerase III subunit beta [Sulfurovum riftiae]